MYQELELRRKKIVKEIEVIEKALKDYPEGELICVQNGKYTNYFVSDGRKNKYIKKTDKIYIHKLAEKKLFNSRLKDRLAELKATKAYLKHYSEDKSCVNRLYASQNYNEIISSIDGPGTAALKAWSRDDSSTSTFFPEQLKFLCTSGHRVRSKSELLIDQTLFSNNIPFRYEDPLILNDITIYPDFTIRHPRTGEYFYWEHFGLMESQKYIEKTMQKLNLYCVNGIIPTINLITTYETHENPLRLNTIEKIVEEYFL